MTVEDRFELTETTKKAGDEQLSQLIISGDKKALLQELNKRSAGDQSGIVLQAALASIPVVGPALHVLISEYMPRRQQTRLIEAVTEISATINEIRDQIEPELAETEEFELLLRTTLDKLRVEHREQKRRAFEAILANTLIPGRRIVEDQTNLFFGLVDQLLEPQLVIVKLLSSTEVTDNPHNYPTRLSYLSDKLGTTSAVTEFLVSQLDHLSITNNIAGRLGEPFDMTYATKDDMFTDFGKSFLVFISKPSSK